MAEERVQRRLAAILAADVVGYSRLIGLDEAGTRARFNAHLQNLIEPAIEGRQGRIVKTTGDGLLVEFSSVVDAVECALEIQNGMAGRNTDEPNDQQIIFRIGVNLGDVIIEGEDIHGDGVNIASRLEGLAEPGGLCVSGKVVEEVRNKLEVSFEDMGAQEVKNIAEPVRVYGVHGKLEAAPTEISDASLPLSEKPSIAVLPFQNMSGDPEQEYFADGTAEEIITALSRFRWFLVTARNSSFSYKGRNVDVRTVGRELGVRYVLEGSVRKGANRLRITAQLVESATGNHLWAEKYDGALEDVFDLQDRIAEGVAAAIEPSVRQAEIERARRKRPENLDAYDLYLRALPHAWAYTRDGTASAIELLEEALRNEPTYAAAHGLLGFCHAVLNREGAHDPDQRGAGIRHARAVLSSGTDDSVALVYAAFVVALFEGDYDVALGAASKALALTPNSATVLALSALVHAFASRFDTAIGHAQRSLQLSPFDPTRCHADVAIAWAHFFSGRYVEAIEAAKRAVHGSPSFVPGFAVLAASYACLGQTEKAREAIDRLLAVNSSLRVRDLTSLPRFAPVELEFFGAALHKAGLPE